MPNFKRRPGESASEWRRRLRTIDAFGLTRRQLNDLTAYGIEAAFAERREGATSTTPVAETKEGTSASADREGRDPLETCKQAVRALSPADRLHLIWWLQGGMRD
jgi:hypothetical protein